MYVRNIILTNTTLKNVGTLYLPSADFITNADVSTYLPHLNLNCPQIVTRFGAVVEVDNEYPINKAESKLKKNKKQNKQKQTEVDGRQISLV